MTAERSGAPILPEQRVGLPDPTRPIRLSDGRVLTCAGVFKAPASGPPVALLGGSAWRGPKGLLVIVTLNHTGAWGPLLQVSLSYAKLSHRPSWADITAVKDALFGDVDACMILPRKADWVNVRENCFQLVQTPQVWGIR